MGSFRRVGTALIVVPADGTWDGVFWLRGDAAGFVEVVEPFVHPAQAAITETTRTMRVSRDVDTRTFCPIAASRCVGVSVGRGGCPVT
ncbi:hypothetical protein Q0Z83_026900 [Actinoplanes sichuanensis]|nr:hypothetical protein Q0Z83_026900 [Actinoplanes sichuanensis]